MPDIPLIQSKRYPSVADHVLILLGGIFGGCAGLLSVALLVLPQIYPAAEGLPTQEPAGRPARDFYYVDLLLRPEGFLCSSGLGLITGYLPGLAAWYVRSSRKRIVAFIVAAMSATFFGGLLAAVLAVGASV
jgi:hypothetical protein